MLVRINKNCLKGKQRFQRDVIKKQLLNFSIMKLLENFQNCFFQKLRRINEKIQVIAMRT